MGEAQRDGKEGAHTHCTIGNDCVHAVVRSVCDSNSIMNLVAEGLGLR